MPLDQADRAEIATIVRDAVRAIQPANPATRCRADYPHDGKLRWNKGLQEYACECGQRYRKDGKGGLADVAA